MKILVEKVELQEKEKLEKLLQLYLHDISYYFNIDFDSETITYKYDNLDKYFNNSKNFAYFIKDELKNILGMILIDSDNDSMIVQEMFVLNNYKGEGIGEKAIIKIFNLYKGNWIIKALPKSLPAEKFWLKTIKRYTNNNFEIEHTGKYNRAEFTFNNK